MDPLPYNVTISSQAASLDYFPARDTTIDAGWNVTYSDGIQNIRYGPQGKGTACRQTSLLGARITFNWVGTAVYLYGNATSGSYKIRVDGSDITDLPSGQGGVLGVKTGMPYSNHSVVLIALGGGRVSFWYAEVTIGAGYPGFVALTFLDQWLTGVHIHRSPASTTTIPVVLENSDKTSFMANAFFTYSPVITSIEDTTTGWYVDSVVRSSKSKQSQ
ncbi:hypothetical protein MPER_11078 [Moniliophthora perniciosa FA553]|nr:hypothetical protein MPER_11078 [Moniliophthora perniciosa FA553]